MRLSRKGKYRIKVLEKRIADGDLEAMMEYAQRYQGDCPEEVTPEITQKIVKCYETCIDAGNLTLHQAGLLCNCLIISARYRALRSKVHLL